MKLVGTSTQLQVYLFGRFQVESEEESLQLPTRKVERLLAYLVLNPDPHSREKLAALFWGDVPDASARASLRNALSTLRRKLDDQLLSADRQTVQLNPAHPIWVDAQAFLTQATRFLNAPSPDPTVVDLDLYTNDLLVDFYDDWVLVKREELRSLYLDVLLELTQQLRSQSEY